MKNNKNGEMHRGLRVADALCTVLANEPAALAGSEALQFAYFVKAAACGWWTAWQIGGDPSARRYFLRIIQRLDRSGKEAVCRSIFAADRLSEEEWDEATFAAFMEAGEARPSLARSLFLGPTSGYLTDAGLWALKAGQPLRSPCPRFGGKTPEQVMLAAIEERTAFFHQGRVAAFLQLFHAQILAHGGYPDEAWAILSAAERYWESLHDEDAHWRLSKAECRAEIHRAEWLLERTPKTLVDYATYVERAANNAEGLNLPLRAERVRQRLSESLGMHRSRSRVLLEAGHS